ncbi:hypothetical protein AFB00_19705 [Pseudonocardia sp. HH130630-07]|nr:hypothetical protein AFB00_19705 [Pseudonocardia sp. HH130630-07]
MSTNQITVVGNLTRRPQLRHTPGGRAVVDLTVAENYRRRDENSGEWHDVAKTYYTVTCWRKLAEHAAQTLDKGHPVIVVGRMFVEEWVDRDGVMRKTPRIDPISVGPDLRYSAVLIPPRPSNGTDREVDVISQRVHDWEVPAEPPEGAEEPPEPDVAMAGSAPRDGAIAPASDG